MYKVWTALGQPANAFLLSGACPRGADRIAETVWAKANLPIKRFPADWERFGKRAGFVRNAEMVNSGPNICLAFIRNNSRGASHTRKLAMDAGIPVRTFLYPVE